MKQEGMTLLEVIEYGPIVAVHPEFESLVTINGAYLNWWNHLGDGKYVNTECRSGHPDLYTLTVAKAMDLAKKWIEDVEEELKEDE